MEEWLARRPLNVPPGPATGKGLSGELSDDDGYAKVVDVYCLHVLPRLAEWDYAMEFLKYEVELPVERRTVCRQSLLLA